MEYRTDCVYFNGYKPCRYKRVCAGCPHYSRAEQRILIISLEALGAVLRSTCLLAPIKRRYPNSHITWLTFANARPLLDCNPQIDRIMTYSDRVLPVLDHLKFDVAYVVDKSMLAGALGERVHAREKFGFGLDERGNIAPLSSEADYQYAVGLDDNLKFFVNQKPETQQITETMGLPWQRDPYLFAMSDDEKSEVRQRRATILAETGAVGIIGYSTGCSLLYPYKKFTVERSIEIIRGFRETYPDYAVALLGGQEDSDRNLAMKQAFADDPRVVMTPTTGGLRSGILWMDTADMILTGCSLGLHISIALKKKTLTWFGVSCAQEIDLYDLGIKLYAQVSCSPCWKKSCDQPIKCYDMVSAAKIVEQTGVLLRDGSDQKKSANS